MTETQRTMYLMQRKDPTTAGLLCFFLGGLGAHHFYLGNAGLAFVYCLFCWTFIPLIISVIELFSMKQRVLQYNIMLARQVLNMPSAVSVNGSSTVKTTPV
jgi:TM2 domain-containing membrane protein YozV